MYSVVFLILCLSLPGIVRSDGNCSAPDTLITFDDLPSISSLAAIPDTYYDLFWSNFGYILASSEPLSGYPTALSSGLYDAFNGGGNPMTISSPANSNFNISSFIAAAAWNYNLTLSIYGKQNGTTIYQQTLTLQPTNSSFVVLNWAYIDAITFNTSGGTQDPNYGGSGAQFAMDNLCIDISSFYIPTLYPITTTAPTLVSTNSDNKKITIIVGSVIGGIIVVFTVAGVIAWCIIRSKRRS